MLHIGYNALCLGLDQPSVQCRKVFLEVTVPCRFPAVLFLPDGCDCSMAELRPEEKNAISHRGNALKILKEELRNYYADK